MTECITSIPLILPFGDNWDSERTGDLPKCGQLVCGSAGSQAVWRCHVPVYGIECFSWAGCHAGPPPGYASNLTAASAEQSCALPTLQMRNQSLGDIGSWPPNYRTQEWAETGFYPGLSDFRDFILNPISHLLPNTRLFETARSWTKWSRRRKVRDIQGRQGELSI